MTASALLSLLVLSSVSWTGTDAVYRLQEDSRPLSYKLHMEPHIMEGHFNGSVTIEFIMDITTTVLAINQKDLTLQTVVIEGIPLIKWDIDNEKEVLHMYCKYELLKDHIYTLKIKFHGELTESSQGFFKSRYFIGNETRFIAATHFQPTYARLAFPCWDEPVYKAIFNISIRHLSNYTAVISNMPVLNQTHHDDNTITTYFHSSMLMSTYLVAFVVSDYTYKRHRDDKFKIYTKPDSADWTELAHSFSVQAMKVMEEYTEIPYFKINPKMDLVTVRDLKSSGMENWGMTTFKEDKLLYKNGISTTIDKDNIILLIAHEFSHQWFGNLVSPLWWDFAWLSEGMATYYHYYIPNKVKPSWRIMESFAVKAMQKNAFMNDVLDSRPMNKRTDPQDDLAVVFLMSYERAACVIRMLSHIVTETVFHTAMRNYLRNNSFNVVDPNNLVKHIQDAAGQKKTWGGVPLKEIVRNWIMKSGFPMVTVKKTSPGYYSLRQEQYLPRNIDATKMWWIPIQYATNQNLNFTDTTVTRWMRPNVNYLMILEPETDWILLNKQQTGYYRVNYDDEIWQKLTEYLKSSNMHRIHPVNRAQLIDDVLTLARNNYTTYETALSLTLYLNREIDFIPWMSTFEQLRVLQLVMFPSKHYDIFKHYIRYIMHSVTKNVTYVASPKDDHPTKLLKHKAMEWACLADVKECLDEAHKEFNAWLKDPKHHLDPDLRNTILCTGLRNASEAVWDKVLTKLSQELFERDWNINPLTVLGCSSNPRILKKFLIYSARPYGKIKFVDAAISVLDNTDVSGVGIVLDVLEFNMTEISHMHEFYDQIYGVVQYISYALATNEDFLRVSEFIASLQTVDTNMMNMVSNSMETVNWITDYGPIFDAWLLKHEELFKSTGTEKTFMSLLLICSIFNTMIFRIFL